jgi:putative hydrolase of the HAD superfamily
MSTTRSWTIVLPCTSQLVYWQRLPNVDVDPDEFSTRWKQIHAQNYPRYLRGELGYERMCRERVWSCVSNSLSVEAADKLFATYMNAYQAAWRLFDDVLSCLSALSAFRLGIISNGRSEEQRRKLKVLGIEHRFEHVVISEEAGVAKPDPGIFLGACSAMGVAPEAVVFIGDNYEIDYVAAREAGLSAVWLDRVERVTPAATVVRVASLGQLPGLLANQSSGL